MLAEYIKLYTTMAEEEAKELRYYYNANKEHMDRRSWLLLGEILEAKRVCEDLVQEALEGSGYIGDGYYKE